MGNDWVNNVDPDGGVSWTTGTIRGTMALGGAAIGGAIGHKDGMTGALMGAAIGAGVGYGASYINPAALDGLLDVSSGLLSYSASVIRGAISTRSTGNEEIWYYGWVRKPDDEVGHAILWDPNHNKVYEINHANRDAGSPDGKKMWTDFRGLWIFYDWNTPKSTHYEWDLSKDDADDPNDKSDFWDYRGGRGKVDLYPVVVKNPDKIRQSVQGKSGKMWRYNIFFRNCKHYCIKKLRKGGARVRLNSPFPRRWKNSKKAGSWNNANEAGKQPR